ncbi:MAG TPA: hypothetical protein VHN11_19395, partial [Xanthobacteraceae bacterium]|nr:hypothetical protein [Xanthobacteraceae bacterium]
MSIIGTCSNYFGQNLNVAAISQAQKMTKAFEGVAEIISDVLSETGNRFHDSNIQIMTEVL